MSQRICCLEQLGDRWRRKLHGLATSVKEFLHCCCLSPKYTLDVDKGLRSSDNIILSIPGTMIMLLQFLPRSEIGYTSPHLQMYFSRLFSATDREFDLKSFHLILPRSLFSVAPQWLLTNFPTTYYVPKTLSHRLEYTDLNSRHGNHICPESVLSRHLLRAS